MHLLLFYYYIYTCIFYYILFTVGLFFRIFIVGIVFIIIIRYGCMYVKRLRATMIDRVLYKYFYDYHYNTILT